MSQEKHRYSAEQEPPGQRSWKNCFNQLGMKAAMLYFIAEASMTCHCQSKQETHDLSLTHVEVLVHRLHIKECLGYDEFL
jgi:hypothetical protein